MTSNVGKSELFRSVFPDGSPETIGGVIKGMVSSPELFELVSRELCANFTKGFKPNQSEWKAELIKTSTSTEEEVTRGCTEIYETVQEIVQLFNDNIFVKNVSSRPIQEGILRFANNPGWMQMMSEFSAAFANPVVPKKLSEIIKEIKNPQGKKLAESVIKKFKLAPQSSLKDKLAKVWEAIKNFFKKVFCYCCKKKETTSTAIEANVTQQQNQREIPGHNAPGNL
jgi:hypothetical protein